MVDPLAEVVMLLQPGARFSKVVFGAGPWHIRRSDAGQPFYCLVLEGACRLVVDGHEAIELLSGDFILIPAAYGVATSKLTRKLDANFNDAVSAPSIMGPWVAGGLRSEVLRKHRPLCLLVEFGLEQRNDRNFELFSLMPAL